ncbi:TVP38/TMEM64 family protein [Rickettsiales bacterium LUAb2]
MHKKITIFFITLIIISIIYIYYKYDLTSYLSLASLKLQKHNITLWYNEYPWRFVILFTLLYIFSIIITLPLGYFLLCAIAGFLFKFYFALLLVLIPNVIGTLVTFFSARFLFREYFETKFKKFFIIVNKKLAEEGEIYLFFIRLIPIIPVFVTNVVMGLTKMKWYHYCIISQLGMLPELILCIYIGKELDTINNIHEIFSIKNLIFIICLVISVIISYYIYKKIKSHNTNHTISKN